MTNLPALQRSVADMVAEYDAKAAAVPDAIKAFEDAQTAIKAAACVGGAYAGSVISGGNFWVDKRVVEKTLLESGWRAIYSRLNIDMLATARDKALWEKTLADPPPLTVDNAIATFGDYLFRSRFHVLRGLAEAFSSLDPAYKSHERVKIGVKGLPKRIILNYWTKYSDNGARRQLRDVINAIRTYQGRPLMTYQDMEDLIAINGGSEYPVEDFSSSCSYSSGRKVRHDGKIYRLAGNYHLGGAQFEIGADRWVEIVDPEPSIEIRVYPGTQTCHVIFRPDLLLDVNRALAEFYGDVLPDAEEKGVKPRPSTAVAKDLQYYPTPTAVVQRVLDEVGVMDRQTHSYRSGGEWKRLRILEPSCGDGRFLDEIVARGHYALGIEVHAGLAKEAKDKGHLVWLSNFLDVPATPEYDMVVMNPPFYGRHYVKHVRHALKFLKPGGRLVSILPATAWYDHKELPGKWHDLPTASFAESGTNIATGFLIMKGGV